jgi:predicted phage terminase large subunit-like protein
VRRELARRRVIDFTLYTKPKYQVNWHHAVLGSYLDRFLAGEIERLMVFMPPRHGKTELASRRLPALALGQNPDTSIIACSYAADLASLINRDVQRIIESPAYQELFPGTQLWGKNVRTIACGAYLRNSDLFEIVNREGVYRSAGVGGSITGMGGRLLMVDDPFKNAEEADSATVRDKVWEWWGSTFYTRAEDHAQILVTQTRWNEDDLSGRLIALADADPNADKWVIVIFPALAEGDRAELEADISHAQRLKCLMAEDPREPGAALWPEKKDVRALAQIKIQLGSRKFAALYQQRPTPAEGGVWKRHWWQFYTALPPRLDEIIQSWDMAFKDLRTSDYVVGQVWGRLKADLFLLDEVRDRLDFPATLEAVRRLSAKWPQARRKLVEDKANGTAVIAMLKKEIPGLIAVEPMGSKEARASAASPEIEAGNVWLPNALVAPWITDWIEECSAFPTGTHDDRVDAASQAINHFALKGRPKVYTIDRLRELGQ